jgi:predicted SAM-dependent methyltransferase
MKIQLSDKRIIKDAVTVFSHPGPEVDIVMDLKNLTFRPESISEIYAFHVVDHLFPEEAEIAIANWFNCMAPKAELHLLNDDFEYLARAYVGGDIDVDLFNDLHNHPCQCTQDNVIKMLEKGGFKRDNIVIWYGGSPEGMDKKHYEFIITAHK